MKEKLTDQIEMIQEICSRFGWRTNRMREFKRAARISQEINAHLKIELNSCGITW